MNEIIDILPYSEKTVRVRIQNANIAVKAQPGNFVIIKFSEDGQRIPFSIVATDPELGLIDIIIHRGDGLDNILGILRRSQHLPDLLGPLGIAADIPEGKRLLFCGDGSGFVPLLPLMRTARTRGCHVAAIVSEFSSQMHCLLPEISASSDEVLRAEEDTFLLIASRMMYEGKVDKVIMSGPTLMMKRLADETRRQGVEADCLLNMLMIDGIGLCGVCRVMVGGERKQTCTDGPIFNAHLVDFDSMLNRQRLYE